jgi:ubiquinone/menaquinone biosynthesis C-methylase UbiE
MREPKKTVENQWDEIFKLYSLNNRDFAGFPFNVLSNFKDLDFLEAGCGDGEIAIFMATDQNCKVTALDISDRFLELTKSKIISRDVKNIKTIKGDVRKMPFKAGTFDLIFSGGVIEHFEESIISLKEHTRVLKTNGHLLIGVPSKYGMHYSLKIIMSLLKIWDIGYEKSFGIKEFQEILKNENLEIQEKYYIPIRASENQKFIRKIITKFISVLDRSIGGVHMQYYLCKKLKSKL